MNKIPQTYSEWIDCLDRLKETNKDQEVLAYIEKGSIELTVGVRERFLTHFTEGIKCRLDKMVAKFDLEQKRNGSDLNLFTNSLLNMRREYKFLVRVCQIQALPEEYSTQLVGYLQQSADDIQKELEESSKKQDYTGVLTSIIRKNKINSLEG